MKRKLVTVLVAAVSLSAILSGCNAKESAGTSDEKQKIRFASWDSADGLDRQQALVDQFNDSQDAIEVTLEAYGGDYDTKISAADMKCFFGAIMHPIRMKQGWLRAI